MSSDSVQTRKETPLPQLAALFLLIVAGIVLLGWLLVGFAAMNPVATSADPASKPGPILLEPTFAQISGEALFHPSRRPPGPHIAHWKRLDDVLRWRFHVNTPGRYRIDVRYSCDKANAGGVLAATVAGQEIEFRIEGTKKDGPLSATMGEVTIPDPGWHEIELSAKSIPGTELIELYDLLLTPVQ